MREVICYSECFRVLTFLVVYGEHLAKLFNWTIASKVRYGHI